MLESELKPNIQGNIVDNHKDKTEANSKKGSKKISLPGSIMMAAVVGFGVVAKKQVQSSSPV